MRRPVGCVYVPQGERFPGVVVVCDDGTVWLYNENDEKAEWVEWSPAVPWTPALPGAAWEKHLERIHALAARALDNDGDNKAGARSMREALKEIVRLVTP